ncbi:LysR family transcriptional regulator [Sphingomonas sp. CROZ-RG-20F-R02-07]|uniref:LysR family transcriptional regulator n=1 Tax=Sphingomonas sp. CROZ-RG-20F-R02-07 TaxID=2914832 RepID=UPI001F5AF5E9|nr:LysR family transcriptional regulator [Sphingomonas sp. CROZ-RG-20F-R02-07]
MEPFDLNLRHLRALSPLVRLGSVKAAADAIGLTQPALTLGLAKLERQLHCRLFDRHTDGVVPTPDGLAMAHRAAAAFDRLEQGVRAASRTRSRGFARPEHLMTAAQLRAFLALADHGSFAAAAAASGLSQPTVHRAVRDLEQIGNVALAVRRGRSVQLTAAGRHMARGVRLAAADIAAGIVDLGTGGESVTTRIAIGAMPLPRARVLPAAIAAWQGEPLRTTIAVVEGSWRELVEPLRDGILDMMVGALRDAVPPGLEQRPLFEDRLVVVGRAGHPLRGATPTLDALARCDWIVAPPATPLRTQWEAMFAGRPTPAAPIECGSMLVIRAVLARTDLLTLLSPDQIALEVAAGTLATIGEPLAHTIRTIGLTVRTGWRPTAAQARFVALLEAAAADTNQPPSARNTGLQQF